MEQGHKVLFILLGLAIIAALLGYRTIKPPAILGDADPTDVKLGMSATNEGRVVGPAFMQSNRPLFNFPWLPMQPLDPVTSVSTVGA